MKSFSTNIIAASFFLIAACSADEGAEVPLCMPGCSVVPLHEGDLIAAPNQSVAGPVGVQVFDGNGQFVEGVAVRFSIESGGGIVTDTLVYTSDIGVAQTNWLTGHRGEQILSISVAYSCDERGGFDLAYTAVQEPGDCPEAIDRNGMSYPTVQIGSQCWMARNLRTKTFQDGSALPRIVLHQEWAEADSAAYTSFDNNKRLPWVYGYLYNWHAVSDERNICPEGWRIPTTADFDILAEALGGPEVAGGLMKFPGDQFWTHPNTSATNASGFSAVGGSYRHFDGNFYDFGNMATFWTIDEAPNNQAWMRYLYHDQANIETMGNSKNSGLNVRCIAE